MGKKRAKRAATKQPPEVQSGKARVELRFEEEVLAGIKRLAEASDISMNQLMHGLASWAVQHGLPGTELIEDTHGFITARRQPGCVSFGKPGNRYTKDEREELAAEFGIDAKEVRDYSGRKLCVLDFTVRRVVRED